MPQAGRQRARRPAQNAKDMNMQLIDELRRRIESLESNHSGIGSEVAVVKAEVGAIHRDINFLRASAESMGNKMDTVISTVTAIQASNSTRGHRDLLEMGKAVTSIVVGIFVVIGMFVGAVTYLTRHDSQLAMTSAIHESELSAQEKRLRR